MPTLSHQDQAHLLTALRASRRLLRAVLARGTGRDELTGLAFDVTETLADWDRRARPAAYARQRGARP